MELEQPDEIDLAGLVAGLGVRASFISGQRSAFATLQRWIDQCAKGLMTSQTRYELRESVREDAGLSLYPALEAFEEVHPVVESADPDQEDERILDVGIIAIHW